MTKQKDEVKYLDLEKTIAESDYKLLKSLPKFIIRLIMRIAKQRELNALLNKYSEFEGIAFLGKVLEEFNIKIEVEGLENLPENGKCFFASNHPFGFVDGLVLTNIISKKYGTLKSIGNDVFMFVPHLHSIIAAVSVFGRSPKEYFKALDEVYNSDIPITHFPAGLVSRLYRGKVQDSEWKKSFITKSITCNRGIVPVFFYGRNSNLFYLLFLIRSWLGIKATIELMLLPREFFRKRNKTIKVKIGKPLPSSMFDKSMSHYDWAQKVKQHVYAMGNNETLLGSK